MPFMEFMEQDKFDLFRLEVVVKPDFPRRDEIINLVLPPLNHLLNFL